jgi:hypothetical protein
MSESTCAYCNLERPLTREHLWPAALHARLLEANVQASNHFWLARLRREIPSEPKIRDVCAVCNNGELSRLDDYICRLFDRAFVDIPQRHEHVRFEYDYHFLNRWLLKMCYNSARIHNSRDLFALRALLPYILGNDLQLGRSVDLFLQLVYPESLPSSDLPPDVSEEFPPIFKPLDNRVGHCVFELPGEGQKVLRRVQLRSYCFYIAFSDPKAGRAEQHRFRSAFLRTMAETRRLQPSLPCINMQCNGIGAWVSFRDSRTNQLVFKNDLVPHPTPGPGFAP